MIIKERKIPIRIKKLEALLRRLPKNHPKFPQIVEQLAINQSGFTGEKSLDFPLTFLPNESYYIFHDLRLQAQGKFFQMDTVLLTSKYVIILEVKNITGSLYFDSNFNQLIRTKAGEETAFPDPILQVKRQQIQLSAWFSSKKLSHLPIIPLVVISHPQAVIRASTTQQNVNLTVVRSDFLPTKIQQIDRQYKTALLNDKELKKLIRQLKKDDQSGDYAILERFQIDEADIVKGVICRECGMRPLRRGHGMWICSGCGGKSRHAHVDALQDYYYLFGPKITNASLRSFLCLDSPFVASRLLKAHAVSSSGTNKATIHYISF